MLAGRSLAGDTLVARQRGPKVAGFLVEAAGVAHAFTLTDLTKVSGRRLGRAGVPRRYAGNRNGNRRGRYMAVVARLAGKPVMLGRDISVLSAGPVRQEIIGLDMCDSRSLSTFALPLARTAARRRCPLS